MWPFDTGGRCGEHHYDEDNVKKTRYAFHDKGSRTEIRRLETFECEHEGCQSTKTSSETVGRPPTDIMASFGEGDGLGLEAIRKSTKRQIDIIEYEKEKIDDWETYGLKDRLELVRSIHNMVDDFMEGDGS